MPRLVALKDPKWTGRVVRSYTSCMLGFGDYVDVRIDGLAPGPRLTGRAIGVSPLQRWYFWGTDPVVPGVPPWCEVLPEPDRDTRMEGQKLVVLLGFDLGSFEGAARRANPGARRLALEILRETDRSLTERERQLSAHGVRFLIELEAGTIAPSLADAKKS